MKLEYDVQAWVEEEKDKIPKVMDNFFKAVKLDFTGRLLVQKTSSSGSVQIMPQEGLIQDLSLREKRELSASFLGENMFKYKGMSGYIAHTRLIIENEWYHVFACNVDKLPR